MVDARRTRGAVLVETAIVLPVFILVLIGTLEFGVVLHDYLLLQNASREGARFGVVGSSQASIEQRVRDYAFELNDPNLVVEVINAQGERGSTLTVRASYPVPLITLLMQSITNTSNFNLRAESFMRME